MKKILFVFNSLGIGGSQKIEAFVANACKEAGFEVAVLSFTNVAVGVDLSEDIPIQYVIYDRCRGIKGLLKKIPFLFRLRSAIKRESPDAICVFLADMTRVVEHACKGLNIPIIASERGAPGRHGNKIRKYNSAFKKCHTVIFQTETARKYYRLDEKKVRIIPNPCFLRWEQTNELVFNEKTICAAGRLCKQKRFDVLIDSFLLVREKHPEYKLYIYGSGKLEGDLLKQISDCGLEESVFLPGYVKDVFASHGKPEIFVLSSDYEGIPNILMEAMALGIACVSTDCEPGGADLLFDHGRLGLLSPIGDSKKMADNIIRLIENPILAEKLRESVTEVSQTYSVNRIKALWMEVFRSI